jgi:hypothetical protein
MSFATLRLCESHFVFSLSYKQNSLTLAELWATHNEHRMFLPRLATLATGIPSDYDTRLPMILSQLFMFAGFLLLPP